MEKSGLGIYQNAFHFHTMAVLSFVRNRFFVIMVENSAPHNRLLIIDFICYQLKMNDNEIKEDILKYFFLHTV